jgi:hypothetical protein
VIVGYNDKVIRCGIPIRVCEKAISLEPPLAQ